MLSVNAYIKELTSTIEKAGFCAYIVGGSVRDLIIGREVSDWDIATNARPEDVSRLFDKVIPTGIDFGTVAVMTGIGPVEVTTFRKDGRYSDGRRPEKVTFSETIEEDLSRRDFTVNAIAYSISKNEIIDPHHGRDDIKKKVIRAVGDPVERFSEDGLRSLRACRFAAKLGFEIEQKTFEAIRQKLDVFKKVSVERIHDELVKMLSAEKPSVGFEYMKDSGLLELVIPELMCGIGVEQPKPYHVYDVYYHNIYACDRAPAGDIVLRLAALLHDVAKPGCKKEDTFYNHDMESAGMAEEILKRLRFSREHTERTVNLIRNHMFNYTPEWSDSAVRRFVRRVGLENISDLFGLRLADIAAMEREIDKSYIQELQKRIDKIVEEENALNVSDLKINGNEIMKMLGIAPGKKIGEILGSLLERVLDDPGLNEKNTLLELAKKIGGK